MPSLVPAENVATPEQVIIEKVDSLQPENSFKLAAYEDVYDFAYSAQGMNQTSLDATAFADLWASKCVESSFELFKKKYKFAYSASGMNMTSTSAIEWAMGKTECLRQ